MARPDLLERVAQVFKVPIRLIRTYVGPMRVTVAAKRVQKVGPVVNKQRQNELYEKWRNASNEEKPTVAEELFREVLKHARAVVWRRVPEASRDLPREIASAVIERLGEFREGSEFTTWVHRIALNMSNLELRARDKSKKRLLEYDDDNFDESAMPEPRAAGMIAEVENQVFLHRMKKELSAKDYVVLECMIDQKNTPEIAEVLGDSRAATESRARRVRTKVQKIIASPRRKMTTSGN
jgi:RNA polymerase sigma-70 factor (ECF subfamily)